MLDLYGEYVYERSPRGVVERLTLDPGDIEREEAFWYCLTCQECTFFCPVGINFQRFMMELRELLLDSGQTDFALFCTVCGIYLMPKKEFEALQKGDSHGSLGELLSVCPRCKKSRVAQVLHRVAPRDKRIAGV
jgi:Fe-S oxidoreductase